MAVGERTDAPAAMDGRDAREARDAMAAMDTMATGCAGRTGLSADITVVVLTYNRRECLRGTLARLLALPERPPVIVIDNASTDGTHEMVRRDFPSVLVLPMQRNLGAAARNVGAGWATTPYVAFCDDDCWWAPGSLRRVVDLFARHPQVAALTARVLVGAQQRTDPASERMAASPLPSASLPGHAVLGLLAGATAFRTEAFRAAGGYHPRFFIGGEETLLALDLAARGWRLVYAPELVVHHHPSPTRDGRQRQWLLSRNAIWSAWLRLPWRAALGETRQELPRLARLHGWRGLASLVRGLPWVWRERRVAPDEVLAWWERLRDFERIHAMRG